MRHKGIPSSTSVSGGGQYPIAPRYTTCLRCGVRFVAEGGVARAVLDVGFSSQALTVILSMWAIKIGLRIVVQSTPTLLQRR